MTPSESSVFDYQDETLASCAESLVNLYMHLNSPSQKENNRSKHANHSNLFFSDMGQLMELMEDALSDSYCNLPELLEEQHLHKTDQGQGHPLEEDKANIVQELLETGTCQELFEMHQSHFKRSGYHTHSQGRYQRFLKSVLFVHCHNSKAKAKSLDVKMHHSTHTVNLNQFSDLHETELPLSTVYPILDTHDDNDDSANHRNIVALENAQDIQTALDNMVQKFASTTSSNKNPQHQIHVDKSRFTNNMNHSHHGSHQNKKGIKKKNKHHKHKRRKNQKNNHALKPIRKKSSQSSKDKEFITLQRSSLFNNNKKSKMSLNKYDWKNKVESSEVGDFVVEDDEYRKHLNWATNENPDGVPLVHPAVNQGTCGSCWAFAATGTLEANVSRHAAFAEFKSILSQYPRYLTQEKDNIPEDIRIQAVAAAQETEKTAFSKTKLSVQELLDCDTQHDQGCHGGNPLLAYPFIHKYGLVSDAKYPYEGSESKCHKKRLSDPIVTSDSWGVLASKDEENMEMVLRYLGPIAVGMNGSADSFLAYDGGIFDTDRCKTHPNHALLIVGYGEESTGTKDRVTKYWIARNSWGRSWGEDGFVRIKRKSGSKKKSSGVCGIAKNPSVSLGGRLLDPLVKPVSTQNKLKESKPISTSHDTNLVKKGGPKLDRHSLCLHNNDNHSHLISFCEFPLETYCALSALCILFIGMVIIKNRSYRLQVSQMNNESEKNEYACISSPSQRRSIAYGSISNVTVNEKLRVNEST